MAGKRYSIYKLTSPSGRSYVGFTGQPVEERWRQHAARAAKGARNPLCAAIRKYGRDAFVVETLAVYDGLDEALRAEVAAITELTNAYNVSPGGDYDGGTGSARFKELLSDPVWRAAYSARLSAALKASPSYQARVPELVARLAAWREDNPAKAYRASMRNLRIGVNRHGRKKPKSVEHQRLPRTPKSAAAKLHKSMASREAAKRHWSEMDQASKTEITSRIAASVRRAYAGKTDAERAAHEAQLAKARERIDHGVRKARQREALEAYWTPERRAEFGARVRARNAARKAKTDADV